MVTVGYNQSTGKALMGTGGALCIGCCGGGEFDPDANCGGCTLNETPLYLEVTLSGIGYRSGCECTSPGTYPPDVDYIHGSNDPNGTYILEHNTDGFSTCRWSYTVADTATIEKYEASGSEDCNGSYLSTETYNYFRVMVLLLGGNVYAYAGWLTSNTPNTVPGAYGALFTGATSNTSGDCAFNVTINGVSPSVDCHYFGSGGGTIQVDIY